MRDLGVFRAEEGLRFRAWLPFAGDLKLVLYDDNLNERIYPMLNEWNDCWSVTVAWKATSLSVLSRCWYIRGGRRSCRLPARSSTSSRLDLVRPRSTPPPAPTP